MDTKEKDILIKNDWNNCIGGRQRNEMAKTRNKSSPHQ